MRMKTTAPAPTKNVSHKGSITGFVLAVLSLLSSAIGHGLIHLKPEQASANTEHVERAVGNAVSTGTTKVLGAVIGVPFLVVGITLAILSVFFVVLRLRKVHTGGFIFSAIVVFMAVWSFKLSIAAFELIKAHPAT